MLPFWHKPTPNTSRSGTPLGVIRLLGTRACTYGWSASSRSWKPSGLLGAVASTAEEGPPPLAPQRRADLATSPAAGAVDRHPGAGPDRSAGLGQRPGPAGPHLDTRRQRDRWSPWEEPAAARARGRELHPGVAPDGRSLPDNLLEPRREGD